MEFVFTEEQAMIAETVRSFFAEQATSQRTRAAMDGDGLDRETWQGFCTELGLGGIGIDDAYGGVGLGMVEFAIVAEAAGSSVAAIPLLGLATAAQALAAGGSQAQKARWLPRVVAGEVIVSAVIEPGLAFADGGLSGSCGFVPHGAVADLIVCVNGPGAWLVPADAPGVSVIPQVTMDQTRPLARVEFNRAMAESLPAPAAAISALQAGGWLCLAAEALGGAQAALDRTVAYSRERVQFGRTIGSFQAYKHRLADMMVEIEQARSAVYWAASAIDGNDPERELALHAAKGFCADTYRMCAGNMIQLHGGIGFTWEHDAHLFFKRARAISSMMGDSDWHREQVASMIIGAAA